MGKSVTDDLVHTLRERGARYIVDTQGQPLAVLLTLEEYEHYLELLDDEADSQDAEREARFQVLDRIRDRAPELSAAEAERDVAEAIAAVRATHVESGA